MYKNFDSYSWFLNNLGNLKKNEWAQNRALRITGPILQSTVLENKIIQKLKKTGCVLAIQMEGMRPGTVSVIASHVTSQRSTRTKFKLHMMLHVIERRPSAPDSYFKI